MLKITKYFTILLICFSLIIPTSTVRALAANDSDNSFTFIDQNNNKITLIQESDGTIKQYLNDELTNSSKLNEENNMIVEIEYDEGKQSNVHEINIDDMIEDANPTSPSYESTLITYQQLDDLKSANLQSAKNAFPYSSGYSYVKSYKNTTFGLTSEGYKKSTGSTFTSEKVISFTRDMTISTAVSILIAAVGGPVTWAVAVGALTGALASVIINGIITRNISGKAHYEIKWESWLGIVNGWNYYKNQGTQYLRVLIDSPKREALRYVGPTGYVYDFDTFLRDSTIDYTNR